MCWWVHERHTTDASFDRRGHEDVTFTNDPFTSATYQPSSMAQIDEERVDPGVSAHHIPCANLQFWDLGAITASPSLNTVKQSLSTYSK
jgi:hypothetical protein